MAKKIVRNITNTIVRGSKAEPFKTNVQNDLLNDDEDVFVRNRDHYHAITDDIKKIHIPAKNDLISVEVIDKNNVRLIGKRAQLTSLDERFQIITKQSGYNEFEFDLDLSTIEGKISSLESENSSLKNRLSTIESRLDGLEA